MLDRIKEREIIKGIKQNRREDWVELFDAYGLKVWQRVRLFFANDQYANEITREVFIKAAVLSGKLSEESSIWGWLWEIANECLKKEYSRKFRTERVGLAAEKLFDTNRVEKYFDPENEPAKLATKDLAEIVRHSLSEIDPICQGILIGKFIDNQTIRQLSRESGITNERVRDNLDIAIDGFYQAFERNSGIKIRIRPKGDTNDNATSLLLETLDRIELPTDDMLLEIIKSESSDAMIYGNSEFVDIKSTNIQRVKIASLAVLVLGLIIVTILMKGKVEQKNRDLSRELANPQTTETVVTERTETVSQAVEPAIEEEQQIDILEESGVEEIVNYTSELAQNGDIEGLIELLDSEELLEKMLAARFLATIGDQRALPSLDRESKAWVGEDESNIFNAAAEVIRKRLGESESSEEATEETRVEPQEQDVSIRGLVMNQYGEPIPNVIVSSYYHYGHSVVETDKPLFINPIATLERTKAVSDAEGNFELTLDKARNSNNQRVLIFEHPSYGLGWFYLPTPDWKGEISIALRDRSLVAGFITNEAGDPVSNAKVELEIIENNIKEPLLLAEGNKFGVTSDEAGYFEFGNVPADSIALIRVKHNSYPVYTSALEDDKYTIPAGSTDVSIVLAYGEKISGRIIDRENNPVSLAQIYFESGTFAYATNDGKFSAIVETQDLIGGYFSNNKDNGLGGSFVLSQDDIAKGEVTLIADAGVEVMGTLVDTNGNILTDAKTRILFIKPDGEIFPSEWNQWKSSSNGIYQFKGIPAGLDFEVLFQVGDLSKAVRLEEIDAGDKIELGEVVLGNGF